MNHFFRKVKEFSVFSEKVDLDILLGVIKAIDTVLYARVSIPPPVNSKLLTLMQKLFTLLTKICQDERVDAKKGTNSVLSNILSDESSLSVLKTAKSLISKRLSQWLETGKEKFCSVS